MIIYKSSNYIIRRHNMNDNNFGLAINNDVIARMAEMAALETSGVASMGTRPTTLKTLINRNGNTKAVSVNTEHGVINITVYIKITEDKKVNEVAEKVQLGIKEKLQGMTGSAVTRVNVVVTDVVFEAEETAEETEEE
jgi:uncharacterized alkaline shock family protein YloU